MILGKLKVQGFRSLENIEINFEQITMLIGGNDSGKSSVLDVLELVLEKGSPDPDDFFISSEKHTPCEKIEVVLEFELSGEIPEDLINLVTENKLIFRKEYTLDSESTYYWNEYPLDERLRRDDFKKDFTAAEQEDLIRKFDPSVLDNLSNKDERNEWLQNYANTSPQTEGWKPATNLRLGHYLPGFHRYSTMEYNDPSSKIQNTLQEVFNNVIHEKENNQQLVSGLRDIQEKAQAEINKKVGELLSYIQQYDDDVKQIYYDPTIDFSRSIRAGQFQIDCGLGPHYLSKIGDGRKRKMFIATTEWDRDVTLEQATKETEMPPTIRGYDEPDTNLDYEAQRTMYNAIFSIVQEKKTNVQAILCTHSPPMINRIPAQNIRLLRLSNGCTTVEQIRTDGKADVELFLRESARELGITNTLIFYERCFILVEGDTEDNALPIFYKKIYGHSLIEDGICLINIRGNGAAKEFLNLLSQNRKELTLIFIDRDSEDLAEAKLTEEALQNAGFDEQFIDQRILYIGNQEFEDSFSNDVIAQCLQENWPKSQGVWEANEISHIRDEDKKFSKSLGHELIYQYSREDLRSSWSKPRLGRKLASICSVENIPEEITELFELARNIAGCA